ncbi:hypothetical protein TVAG_339200 [Trichomonas vaginalis G3]|uniref:receptor protein-tyrosine kinase n=1 Tax=Trichomonas vaginalis (strain ATCC PRA-98 / G3) TaxID=412133 RepID=A2FMT3_TRIV3|nr:glycine-rich protein family [Trichomonas vaginalis G3]EAX93797.1 hypothetical protein TVAG_339200 [Trichomonas vaginalis G3]KAI5527844.1 glycine-rich protein family [Trichomonas vaginalis G3]|eukprot:XP_001306727.1 hypothetical protein [Trichomonas vaginalis G3]
MIRYKLSKDTGLENVTKYKDQYLFGYPCQSTSADCSPYTIHISSGSYLFEAWGARGAFGIWNKVNSIPGLGGYTSGVLTITKPLTLYLYVGSTSFFNSFFSAKMSGAFFGGASSDVRLYANESFDWSNPLSLRSRIMVSGGGGGAEWPNSIGGNGGGLEGGSGKSDCSLGGMRCSGLSGGGTQISGGTPAPSNGQVYGIPGLFGMSSFNYSSPDFGAVGGTGYYSGASIELTGAAGGGSSFISGYEGCIALNSSVDETPSPVNSSIHYSGIYFTNPIMIQGNQMMPLYYNMTSYGIGNNGSGAIRITILSQNIHTCNYLQSSFNMYLIFDSILTVNT